MKKQATAIRHFLFSQSLADGVRITLTILIPVLLLRHFGYFEAGLALSLGALSVNMVDSPGPLRHKRNAMLASCLLIFIVSFITSLIHQNIYFLITEITIFTFFFSMFNVYGARGAVTGATALLVMILSVNAHVNTISEIFLRSTLILVGGLWYTGTSIMLSSMRPYRAPQRALGDCIRETAHFLSIKAKFFNSRTDIEKQYRRLLSQQVVVHEKQNIVRELLYKTRQIVKDPSGKGRALMLTFVDIMDLYEQITAVYFDYRSLRENYQSTKIPARIAALIKAMATELDNIGFSIQSNIAYKKYPNLEERLKLLKQEVAKLDLEDTEALTLVKIILNLQNIYHRIHALPQYFRMGSDELKKNKRTIEHSLFVDPINISAELLRDNLTIDSLTFRHALRVTIAAVTGFIVAHLLNYGEHSYWILLTIVFIMKPAFGLTKERNIQRLIGTVAGGIIGVAILHFIPDHRVQFVFLVLLMTGTYTFTRLNYIIMVICTTPYVLILLSLLGASYIGIVEERVLDTFIGCAIAFTASYFLFPKWESENLTALVEHVISANLKYLRNFANAVTQNKMAALDYRLARKETFITSSNLSATFQRMLSEPTKKQKHSDQVFEFVVLNHLLSANIATLTATPNLRNVPVLTQQERLILKDTLQVLQGCLRQEDETSLSTELADIPKGADNETQSHTIKEQLEFMLKISKEICKINTEIRIV